MASTAAGYAGETSGTAAERPSVLRSGLSPTAYIVGGVLLIAVAFFWTWASGDECPANGIRVGHTVVLHGC